MIYTLTLNPAIDYVMRFNSFTEGAVNRSTGEQFFTGGKGINVSDVLIKLGHPSKILGFTAGFTGAFLEESLKKQGFSTDFIRLKNGNTRINVKLKTENETDLNGLGPEVTNEDINKLILKLQNLKTGDILVISGSAPRGTDCHIYGKILSVIRSKGVTAVVDTTGDLLKNTLKYRPFLIKPNEIELGELFGVKINTEDEIVNYAKTLQEMGAANVLVSRGEKGALLITETGKIHKIKAVSGKAQNTVGAGDSMLAGFISGHLKTGNFEYALMLATACGAATAFSEGLASKEKIEE
ncbi:MAG: 1-phosphofructokinase, partial [Acutalibacteraceae bacterium]